MPGVNPWLIVGALIAFIATAAGGFAYGAHVERLAWEAAVAEQKADAARTLQEETAKVLAKERENQALRDTIEKDHQSHADELAGKAVDLSRLAGELDSLRDARRGESRCSADRPAAKPAAKLAARPAPADVPGSYSELARIAADADRAAEYARTCRAWVLSLEKR